MEMRDEIDGSPCRHGEAIEATYDGSRQRSKVILRGRQRIDPETGKAYTYRQADAEFATCDGKIVMPVTDPLLSDVRRV